MIDAMKRSMASKALRFARTAPGLVAALSVPLVFIWSGWIGSRIQALSGIEVDPALSGGRILAEFADPIGDDDGPGGYQYPLGSEAARGELDLIRYAVRVPLPRAAWDENYAFWQLELGFAKARSNGLAGGGFRAPAIHVYLDIDGAASGSTESAFGEGELLRFDPAHPWDYVVSADGWSPAAEIRSADGKYRSRVEAAWSVATRRLALRIPLAGAPPLLSSVLSGRPSWHYVLVGAYDQGREGRFASVRADANAHDGGGARGPDAPRVFDMIAAAGKGQAAQLSSQDEAAGIAALVEPVKADPGGTSSASASARRALEEAAAKERAEDEAARLRRKAALASSPAADDPGRLGELFSLGMIERAKAAADSRLRADASDREALAYRGALTAMRAGAAAAITQKMDLVGEAFRDLDAAVAGSSASPSAARISVLLCRASVSAQVPDEVFGRAAGGAADFEAAAALDPDNPVLASSCLEGAALAFEKAGMGDEARSRWATLAAREGLSARLRLELIDRGFGAIE